MIIGICGKSGSGKSTLSKTLTNHYKNIIHLDIDKVGHNVLTIEDVKNAVLRANKIMQENIRRGYTLNKHNNYSWYKENPSTEAGNAIVEREKDCSLV